MSSFPFVAMFRRLVERWRFRLLLGLLVATLFLRSIAQSIPHGESIILVLVGLIFWGVLHGTRESVVTRAVGPPAVVLWVIISLSARAYDAFWIDAVLVAVSMVLAIFVAWATFAALILEAKADTDALAGAIFGYFLLALLWAELFWAVETIYPGSFSVTGHTDIQGEMLYLSLVTITTLGYGDILPISAPARMLVGTEAAFGTLYIAILIGRIVSAMRARPSQGAAASAEPTERED